FQARPKSVRSIVPSSSSPMRSLPQGSLAVPTYLPVSSTSFVIPLTVRFPSTTTASPSLLTDVDSNRSSGYLCMSKKSGDCRCPSRVSSNVVMLVASTVPSIDACSPPSIVPANPGTRPLMGMSPIFLTSNSSDDQTGSIVHVPVGIRVAEVSAMMDMAMLLCVRYY